MRHNTNSQLIEEFEQPNINVIALSIHNFVQKKKNALKFNSIEVIFVKDYNKKG